jgi:hypothetical protein
LLVARGLQALGGVAGLVAAFGLLRGGASPAAVGRDRRARIAEPTSARA